MILSLQIGLCWLCTINNILKRIPQGTLGWNLSRQAFKMLFTRWSPGVRNEQPRRARTLCLLVSCDTFSLRLFHHEKSNHRGLLSRWNGASAAAWADLNHTGPLPRPGHLCAQGSERRVRVSWEEHLKALTANDPLSASPRIPLNKPVSLYNLLPSYLKKSS